MNEQDLPFVERRRTERSNDDAGWESKVLARVSGRLQERANQSAGKDEPVLGWEATVLDTLRQRIEREPK
jgi:hypothetical protein